MAMSQTDTANLINDPIFRGRVKVAALQYAQYLQLQPSLNASKANWIQRTMTQPDQIAQTLVAAVVISPNVQNAGGSSVSDPDLLAATQYAADLQM